MFDSVTGGIGSLSGVISSGFQGLIDGITNFFTSYLNYFQSGISAIVNFVTGFFNSFSSTLSSLFVPSEDYWENGFLNNLKRSIEEKFSFFESFKTAWQVMQNQQGQSLNYQFEYFGHSFEIDFSWYEPYRLSVREFFYVLFVVFSWLKVYEVASNVLGTWTGQHTASEVVRGVKN